MNTAAMGGARAPAVAVMAKVPGLVAVKSRLHHSLTPEMATLLYRCFLLDWLDALLGLSGIERVVAVTPDHGVPRMAALVPEGYRLVAQGEGDLGARMARVAGGLLAGSHPAAIVTGGDSPLVPAARVAEAARVLATDGADLAVGPSEDGGYYLIGVNRPRPALFSGIPWSTDRVLDLTMEKAHRLGLRVHVLPEAFDVDTESDLRRLREEAEAGAAVPRRTRRCLRIIYG